MSLTKDSLLKRQKEIELEIIKLHAQIRVREKQLERLEILFEGNQQILRDFATEEAIEQAKENQKPSPTAEKKA